MTANSPYPPHQQLRAEDTPNDSASQLSFGQSVAVIGRGSGFIIVRARCGAKNAGRTNTYGYESRVVVKTHVLICHMPVLVTFTFMQWEREVKLKVHHFLGTHDSNNRTSMYLDQDRKVNSQVACLPDLQGVTDLGLVAIVVIISSPSPVGDHSALKPDWLAARIVCICQLISRSYMRSEWNGEGSVLH